MDGRSTRGRRHPNDPFDRDHFNQTSHVPIPELIEIVPLEKPVRAEITVPGSKSITNRALILAALADGQTTLQGALWSEDTQIMVEALRKLGFELNVAPDPKEFCNRTISVRGLGGRIPNAGTAENPLEIFVANAGTAARFLATLVCLGQGVYRLHGVPRMHERPQAELFQALRELRYRIESSNDKLPAQVYGTGPKEGKCRVSIEESSQFASALILCSIKGKWRIEPVGKNPEESPYVKLTDKLLVTFPPQGGSFAIEPDASSGAYFQAAEHLLPEPEPIHRFGVTIPRGHLRRISIVNWPTSDWQVDARFNRVLLLNEALRRGFEFRKNPELQADLAKDLRGAFASRPISRSRDLGDSIMMAIVLSPFALDKVRFNDLGRLRVQECERVVALRSELTRCGARVTEQDDSLEISPSELHGAEIETYNDHRMAMCFAILGLKVPGIRIKNPACVKKTFPNFFQKLAAQPPHGLGASILDARTRQPLGVEELFAD